MIDGDTYESERDAGRLLGQLVRVRSAVSDHQWHTLPELSARCGGTTQAVSARLRDLRKAKHGGHKVERRYVRDGLFEYRLKGKGEFVKPVYVCDTEVYRDYFLAALRDIGSGSVRTFEMYEGRAFDVESFRDLLGDITTVTFNGNHFDMPLLAMVLSGKSCEEVKKAADAIILNNMPSYRVLERAEVEPIDCDHIDLIEVSPGMSSLKIYGGRMHVKTMQDLPIDPGASISPAERDELRQYCLNDLAVTEALYRRLLPQIELRERMGATYALDLRSKSDAQIAEAVICNQVGDITDGRTIRQPKFETRALAYRAPGIIAFSTPELQQVLERVNSSVYYVVDSGKVLEPEWMRKELVCIGGSRYQMGVGGLHSTEKCVAHLADDEHILLDRDVASYYPSIILQLGLAPAQMGPAFLTAYRRIVEQRLAAKRSGDTVTADALKITINGSFGKFGSRYSALYSPELLIQTTITGQLALLMLIEQLELAGIPVVSGNTDGVVIRCHKSKVGTLEDIVAGWEMVTGFDTEETRYLALYSRDVNNYIAVKEDGGAKLKGVFAKPGLAKNPTNSICVEAAVEYLVSDTPIEETIRGCDDVAKFVTVRTVKGGAYDQLGGYLGKAIRWYYTTDPSCEEPIRYKVNGYSVPRTEGAMPLMTLPDDGKVPADVDREWYIREAESIVAAVGVHRA